MFKQINKTSDSNLLAQNRLIIILAAIADIALLANVWRHW
jgi:hypothetical protein